MVAGVTRLKKLLALIDSFPNYSASTHLGDDGLHHICIVDERNESQTVIKFIDRPDIYCDYLMEEYAYLWMPLKQS